MQIHGHSQPSGDFEVRHRNPLANDYVVVSRVVLVGYPQVSDGAKLTYWVIYSHDWFERDRGARKGFAFPTIGRLARLRNATERTIQRHVSELIAVGLLTREERPGKPSLLYIEEPSPAEIDRYLAMQGGDKNVTPTPDKNVTPILKQEEDETDKAVNGDEEDVMEEKPVDSRGWASLGEVLSRRMHHPATFLSSETEWLAQQMASQTSDHASIACYRKIASNCPADLIFEGLAILKQARTEADGVRNRGAFFVATIHRLCKERHVSDPLLPSSENVNTASPTDPSDDPKSQPTIDSSYFLVSEVGAVFDPIGGSTDHISDEVVAVKSEQSEPSALDTDDSRSPNWLDPPRKV